MRSWKARTAAVAACVAAVISASAVAAGPALRITHQIAVPGAADFDYLMLDSAASRLYLAHGAQVDVLDTRTEQWIGRVADTPGVRGIAAAADLGLGYTSNGKADTVSVFDLTTFQVRQTLAVGKKPDALLYDPKTQRVLVFNNQSQDMSVIDARRGEVIATVALGGEPEFAVFDAQGLVHLNLEDTNERIVIDPAQLQIKTRQRLLPCQRPVGLAIEASAQRLAATCGNQWMVISATDGQRLGAVRIGAGADAVAWLDGLAYSADGLDGTLSVVGLNPAGEWANLGTINTTMGARRIVTDAGTHRLYVPAATLKHVQGGNRMQGVDGSLRLLVLQR
jgi:YVTN family beta-propeller protein